MTGAVAALLLFFGADAALAQSAGDCSLQPISGLQRQVLHCGDGVSITTERGAHFRLTDRNKDGKIDSAALDGKAMLLDVDSRRVKGGFEVVTPQAIAAVRGTRWAVDVGDGKTSVLVLRGRVAVRRVSAGGSVLLSKGQGVDVDGGSTPLVVKRWPPARVAALLSRLGQ